MALSSQRAKFYRAEGKMLDDLYKSRMDTWQRLADAYDLKFDKNIRDLDDDEVVHISRFYPKVRQIIGSVAFNYPKLFFSVEDEEAEGAAEVLERAAQAALNLMGAKEHVHQAIFDALFTGVGWLRVDFNPKGDEIIAPYVSNDVLAEDFVVLNRVAPGFVHLDPQCPPHQLGYARYIREKMWVPLKFLKDDPDVKNKRQIKASTPDKIEELGVGEVAETTDPETLKAQRKALENGEFVLVERWHDRVERELVTFAPGVMEPIKQEAHPFRKLVIPQAIHPITQQPLFEETGQIDPQTGQPVPGNPVWNFAAQEEGTGYIVENGFPFIPVKFDLHGNSFYPEPHLRYIEDIQFGIVESMSRQSDLNKRTARQGLLSQVEAEENPHLQEALRKGKDGQWHTVIDPNNFKEIDYGGVPTGQTQFEDRLRGYEDEISGVSPQDPDTATEAAIEATAGEVNREWMESKVSKVYEDVIRNTFQICGDPRYTPENFILNVSPDGEQRLTRALTASDFLWNYRMEVKGGSASPLAAQIERNDTMALVQMFMGHPSIDQTELAKLGLSAFRVPDVDKLMVDQNNAEAVRAAQLENDRMLSQFQDPGVLPEQDHQTHIQTHQDVGSNPARS